MPATFIQQFGTVQLDDRRRTYEVWPAAEWTAVPTGEWFVPDPDADPPEVVPALSVPVVLVFHGEGVSDAAGSYHGGSAARCSRWCRIHEVRERFKATWNFFNSPRACA